MARAEHAAYMRSHKSRAKRISDHVAAALVVYTMMLIFVTSPAMESQGTSIFPYFMLVVFVAMVIPACRGMERRWQTLETSDLQDVGLHRRFTIDRVKLWAAAIIIPVILAVLFTVF